MEQVKPEGLTIEATDFEDEESTYPRHIERQSAILSMCDWTGIIEQITTVTINHVNGNMASVQFQRFRHDEPTINFHLASDESFQLIQLLQGDKESHALSELRSLYDALVAENARLKEAIFIKNQIADAGDIEKLRASQADLDHDCVRLRGENAVLKQRVQQLEDAAKTAITAMEDDCYGTAETALRIALHGVQPTQDPILQETHS